MGSFEEESRFAIFVMTTSSIVVLMAMCIRGSVNTSKWCTKMLANAILLLSVGFWVYNLLLIYAPNIDIQLPFNWIGHG